MLIDKLVQRLIDARAKNKLEEFLKSVKERKAIPRGAFRTTGSADELRDAVRSAVGAGHIAVDELIGEIDRVEENGGQHIFLFTLTEEGAKRLTERRLRKQFKELPSPPPEDMYAQLPSKAHMYLQQRGPVTAVKQVYTATYTSIDPNRTEIQADGTEITVRVPVRRRAVNLLLVNQNTGTVEIRVDRVGNQSTDSVAMQRLAAFRTDLGTAFDMGRDVEPIDIEKAFPKMIESRDIFIRIDSATGATAGQKHVSLREATDIRDDPGYNLTARNHRRDAVKAYWKPPTDEEPAQLHAIASVIEDQGTRLAKVYVSAHVEPGDLNNVIARIRQFAK